MIPTIEMSSAAVRALERHETEAHAIGGREIVDQGDALALIDATDPDPFWNRMTSIRWPSPSEAFDRRLDRALTFFAARNRRPHVWPSVVGDEPRDLVARLLANGFADTGRGIVMAMRDLGRVTAPDPVPGVTLEVLRSARASAPAVADLARVLAESFSSHGESDDDADTRDLADIEATAVAVAADLPRVMADPRVSFVLARVDGEPAAVSKVTGGSGLAYLSSIGTRPAFRGRGLATLATMVALVEGRMGGAELAYLGVFEGNVRAQRVYARLGFAIVGQPVPDLLLVG